MTEAKVSIIVPFYNTEKYIGICLKSLTKQIYSDIEIICINDGSTDRSKAIVEELQKEDDRIHLLNLGDRSGPGISRNHGLKKATGKYLMFCDSDDYYNPEMVLTMLNLILTHEEIDMAICNCTLQNTNKTKRKDQIYLQNNRNGIFELTQSLKRSINIVLWNKIYKTDILNKFNIKFIDIKSHEDENFIFKYLSVSRKINSTNKALYNYVYRDGSLSDKKVKTVANAIEYLKCIEDFSVFLEENFLWNENSQYFAEAIIHCDYLFQQKNLKYKETLIAGIYSLSQKINTQKINNKKIRKYIFQIQRGYISNKQFNPFIRINKTEKNIPIIFACDYNYIKYLSITLQSIIENASQNNIYHIIILDCGIDQNSISIIEKQISRYANFKLLIISIKAFLQENKRSFKERHHFTASIYGRLIIPEICNNFDKAIYVDTDMIFNRDIAELSLIDLKDNYIAAVIDSKIEIERRIDPWWANYFKKKLSLEIKNSYINSGLLVFNLEKWRKLSIHNQCIELLANSKEFILPDQDVINIICKNRIHYLDQSWNCMQHTINILNDKATIRALNESVFLENLITEYNIAYDDPKTVLHYTSNKKPWNTPIMENAEKWWLYCKKTEFYEQILLQNISEQIQTHLINLNNNSNQFERQKMETSNYTKMIKNYCLLGISILKIKITVESKKYYLFGIRIAKIVKNLHRKKYYIFGLRVFTLKFWKI
ncbi:MAG: Glycosyl transferase family 2 protein [Candidatus Tokpelaia sp. JSC189]|nr:MAG: Glycosyl transferase family 2 protein [Candidatus Tokpelaia sp. JSC189]